MVLKKHLKGTNCGNLYIESMHFVALPNHVQLVIKSRNYKNKTLQIQLETACWVQGRHRRLSFGLAGTSRGDRGHKRWTFLISREVTVRQEKHITAADSEFCMRPWENMEIVQSLTLQVQIKRRRKIQLELMVRYWQSCHSLLEVLLISSGHCASSAQLAGFAVITVTRKSENSQSSVIRR